VLTLLDEGDRLQVFMTPELIGDPLARLPRVVQVEHGGDGIHAQAVEMVLIQPELLSSAALAIPAISS